MTTRMGPAVSQSIMMQLGSFQFCIATAAYQELTRRTEFRWPSQELFGRLPALQFTGPASESITLAGVIYPEYVGSLFMLAKMRVLAGRGRPLPLISGAGQTLGRWVIESVEEKQGTFTLDGAPRRQDFNLQLKLYDVRQAELTSMAKAVSAVASGSGPVAAATAPTALGKVTTAVGGFAANAAKMASGAVATLTEAVTKVNEVASEVGNAVGPVVASVQSAISTVRSVQDSVSSLKNAVKTIGSFSDLQNVMYGVMSLTSAASNAGALASGITGQLLPDLTQSGAASGTIQTIKDCQATCGRVAVEAAGIFSQGGSILADAKKIFAND